RHLREGLLGLAPCGATMGLLLLELGHAPPRLLQAGRRLRRRAAQRRRLLRPPAHLSRRCPFGFLAPCTLPAPVREPPPSLRRLPPLRRGGAPLAGIAQPLGGERQVTLQPSRLELRIGQATLHLRATRLGRVPRLDPGLALLLRLLQSGPLARQGCRQLLSPL